MPDLKLQFKLDFSGREAGEDMPSTALYAFTPQGKLIGETSVKDGKAQLKVPEELAGQSVRLLIGPTLDEEGTPSLPALARLRPLERRLRIDPNRLRHEIELIEPRWRDWFRCRCVIRGRLVKRVNNPDGGFEDLPICHARVTICEVDRFPRIINRLPDRDLLRLRDDILDHIRRPMPEPPWPEPPIPDPPFPDGPIPDPFPQPPDFRRRLRDRDPIDVRRIRRFDRSFNNSRRLPAIDDARLDPELAGRLRLLSGTRDIAEVRSALVDLSSVALPYLCLLDWLEPFFRYRKDSCRTVEVDETGYFETVMHYPCFGDRPDIHFEAEQWQGSSWVSIYRPSVRCHTHWNYPCGTEVTLRVTSSLAIVCRPDDPVIPPTGVDSWVMPFAVGDTKIWGNPSAAGAPPAGWVRPDGLTDYGGIIDAPFGARLGFRLGFSPNIPDSGAMYYRWSWRKEGDSGPFVALTENVTRRYIKQVPGSLPTFPAYLLGPKAVSGSPEEGLMEFKPHVPPGPGPGDPAGTTTDWPADNFSGDVFSGFLETRNLPPDAAGAAGRYDMRLEVFDSTGSPVTPGSSTFRFIVPTGFASDGVTLEAREAEASEIAGDAFQFKIHVDNNPCAAEIDAPVIGGTNITDDCGFLRYDPDVAAPVTLAFEASHPNGHGIFNFDVIRASTALPIAEVNGAEVSSTGAGIYTGDGAGNFSHGFALSDLLCGPGAGCCTHAAFAEHVRVFAKATNGTHRLSGFDAGDLRAFALAPLEDEP